ncbi:ATP-grasp fold amidoligase family protein [Serratia marcescens]|uniref:ATP-grasp fold amidoligase family protein n=1 Tax=Serratia marcescens TaxID=615 RepID=UPI0038793C4A
MKVAKELLKAVLNKFPWYVQDYLLYTVKFKRLPNMKNPKYFNEFILRRKHFQSNDERFSLLADKIRVRDFISSQIGNSYLIPLLYTFDSGDELIGVKDLSNVVVKPNHGAGMVRIIKSVLSNNEISTLIDECDSWLKKDFSSVAREIHYKYIKPKIMVESLLGDGNTSLTDYKFHMFNMGNGEFDFVLQVINDRFSGALSRKFFVNGFTECYHENGKSGYDISDKVEVLKKILELNKILASDFNYVRIDWYVIDNIPFFGEMTFTPVAGLGTGYGDSLDLLMGQFWLKTEEVEII